MAQGATRCVLRCVWGLVLTLQGILQNKECLSCLEQEPGTAGLLANSLWQGCVVRSGRIS